MSLCRRLIIGEQRMNVELRGLRWAVTASQYSRLHRASEVLGVRQSTLSRRLRDMENCLGAALFERTNGGTHLTTVGLEFVTSAKRILNDVDTEFRRIKSRSRGELGLLTIGVHASRRGRPPCETATGREMARSWRGWYAKCNNARFERFGTADSGERRTGFGHRAKAFVL